jgi:hypothetical protein
MDSLEDGNHWSAGAVWYLESRYVGFRGSEPDEKIPPKGVQGIIEYTTHDVSACRPGCGANSLCFEAPVLCQIKSCSQSGQRRALTGYYFLSLRRLLQKMLKATTFGEAAAPLSNYVKELRVPHLDEMLKPAKSIIHGFGVSEILLRKALAQSRHGKADIGSPLIKFSQLGQSPSG